MGPPLNTVLNIYKVALVNMTNANPTMNKLYKLIVPANCARKLCP